PGALTDRGDDARTDGDVGHESPVHDVHVELVGAARLDPRDVVAEGGEVRREDRGRDLDHDAVIPRSGDRRKRTAVNPSVPWRWGRQRSVPSGSIGSGNSPGGSTRISGWAARNAGTTAALSSGSSEHDGYKGRRPAPPRRPAHPPEPPRLRVEGEHAAAVLHELGEVSGLGSWRGTDIGDRLSGARLEQPRDEHRRLVLDDEAPVGEGSPVPRGPT